MDVHLSADDRDNGFKGSVLFVVFRLTTSLLSRCRGTVTLFAGLLLTGCSTIPPQREMPIQPPPQFSLPGGERPSPDRWWQAFAEPALTALIEQALSENFTLRAAWARLRQAEAVARREGAPLWPSLNAQGSVTRQDSNSTQADTRRQAGFSAAYEIDLWGRLRAASEAAALDADASAADLRTLLVHGARAVLQTAKRRDDALDRWVNALLERKPYNVVTVALANKMARIAWAVVRNEHDYDPARAAGGT